MKRVIITTEETREVYRVAGTSAGNVLHQEVWQVDGDLLAVGKVSPQSVQARIAFLLARPQMLVTVVAGPLRTTAGPLERLARPAAEAVAQAALMFLRD